jgi:hypothetical protein
MVKKSILVAVESIAEKLRQNDGIMTPRPIARYIISWQAPSPAWDKLPV